MRSTLASALVLAATWESWCWYVRRIAAAPEDVGTLVVALAVLAVAGVRQAQRAPAGPLPLATLALLLAGYAASRGVAPPIIRAGLAAGVALFCLHVTVFRQQPPAALWGLAALALPTLPSLHFMLDYPLRLASAALAVGLLRAHGLAVEQQGTLLVWHDLTVQFDAPCSGVNMLWAGLLFTLMGCSLLQLGAARTAAAAAIAVMVVVAGNVLRSVSLFYVETGVVVAVPAWCHEGIGLAAFVLSTLVMLRVLLRLHRRPA